MIRWTIIFLGIALISAFLGFSGIIIGIAPLAQILFIVFMVLFVVSLIGNLVSKRY